MKPDLIQSSKNASQLRALLSAKLAAMGPIGMKEIITIPEVEAIGMKRRAIETVVYSMVKAGTLVKSPNPMNNSRALYSVGTGQVPEAKIRGPYGSRVALSTKPNIQVDLIKSTGRVRLTLDGLTIEIGVVS